MVGGAAIDLTNAREMKGFFGILLLLRKKAVQPSVDLGQFFVVLRRDVLFAGLDEILRLKLVECLDFETLGCAHLPFETAHYALGVFSAYARACSTTRILSLRKPTTDGSVPLNHSDS